MLFINWRRHFDVPNLVYYSNIFKRDRKAKFYFLSDIVFKLIHNYCFRRVLVYYMSYLLKKRWLYSCEKLTYVAASTIRYKKNMLVINQYRTKVYGRSLRHATNVLRFVLRYLEYSEILELGSITGYNKSLLRTISYKNRYIQEVIWRSYSQLYRTDRLKKSISTNILYLLHILATQKTSIHHKSKILHRKCNLMYKSLSLLIKQLVNIIKNRLNTYQSMKLYRRVYAIKKKWFEYPSKYRTLNNTILDVSGRGIKVNYKWLYEHPIVDTAKVNRLKRTKKQIEDANKKSWATRVTTYPIAYHLITKQIHTALYYMILCGRATAMQNHTFLNTNASSEVKTKKHVFILLANNLDLVMSKLEDIIWKQRRFFFKYLNSVFDGTQWLLGPTNKINLFRYLTHLSFRVQDFFKLSHYRNRLYVKSQLSFFYNTLKIREDLLLKLGKRRYKDEFILLNNANWWVNYYMKFYYAVSKKELASYYKVLGSKYNLLRVLDMFVLLEHQVPVFLNKYVAYAFYNVSIIRLNNVVLDTTNNSFVYIGDYITLTMDSSLYDKFLVFFNFLYFLNPLKFQLKHNFLLKMYYKTYGLFNNYIRNKYLSLSSATIRGDELTLLSSYLDTSSYTLDKLRVKSMLLLFSSTSPEQTPVLTNSLYSLPFLDQRLYKDYLRMYSFNKSLYVFNLVEFRASFIGGKTKRLNNKTSLSSSRNKYIYTYENIYNWFYTKRNTSSIYNVFLSRFFNDKVHTEYFKKKSNVLSDFESTIFGKLVCKSNF